LRFLRVCAASAVLAVLVSVLAGCGGGLVSTSATRESPGRFVTRILREEIAGRWGAQWEELHPGQQKFITRNQYVLCSRRIGTAVGTKHEQFIVQQVENAPIHERGVPERTSKLVTISVKGPGVTANFHIHAVLDKGRWRWVLGPGLLQAVEHGECLDGSILSGDA
jgi:hypothetical protein